MPNTITSKHNIRYVPNMTGPDIVKKLRAYLDKEGYQDVQIHVVGDVPWAKQRHDTEIAKASDRMFDAFGAERRSPPVENQASIMGGMNATQAGNWASCHNTYMTSLGINTY